MCLSDPHEIGTCDSPPFGRLGTLYSGFFSKQPQEYAVEWNGDPEHCSSEIIIQTRGEELSKYSVYENSKLNNFVFVSQNLRKAAAKGLSRSNNQKSIYIWSWADSCDVTKVSAIKFSYLSQVKVDAQKCIPDFEKAFWKAIPCMNVSFEKSARCMDFLTVKWNVAKVFYFFNRFYLGGYLKCLCSKNCHARVYPIFKNLQSSKLQQILYKGWILDDGWKRLVGKMRPHQSKKFVLMFINSKFEQPNSTVLSNQLVSFCPICYHHCKTTILGDVQRQNVTLRSLKKSKASLKEIINHFEQLEF